MSTGVSVFLAALGAIFAFAVRDAVPGVDLTMIGYILMVAGLVGLAVSAFMHQSVTRHHTTSTEETARTADGGHVVTRDTRTR